MLKHELIEQKSFIEKMLKQNYGVTKIAKLLEIQPIKLYRFLEKAGIEYRNRDLSTNHTKQYDNDYIQRHAENNFLCKKWSTK
jgi:phage antirepressor YoqD-like protein